MKIKLISNRSYGNSLLAIDKKLCLRVNSMSGISFFDKLFYYVSKLGDGSIYFITLLIIIPLYNKPFVFTFKGYIIAASLNLICYKLIKNRVKRKRPFTALESVSRLIAPPDEFSFPSGHAGAASIFFYCTMYHFSNSFAILAFIWMILIGFSRVYNGVHYPGDVIVGYTMGIIVARFVMVVLY